MDANQLEGQLKAITHTILTRKSELASQREAADEHAYSKTITDSLTSWRENLIDIYGQSISKDHEKTIDRLKLWGGKLGNLLVELELPLDVAIQEVQFYRETIGHIIKNEAQNYQFSLNVFYEVISQFDAVVDEAVYWLSISYTRHYTAKLMSAEYAMNELAIPLVRVSKTTGVLPIVGDLDTKRAQVLMDRALEQGTQHNLDYIIIDLSGVPIIDTMVANQIDKVISALNLVGIRTSLTGIRPEIAQTMVGFGAKFSSILTFSSLHQALDNLRE